MFEPDGPDEIADYLPMPWVDNQSPESPWEPITEPVPAIDYAALSSFLKKVHNWEEIASVVGRNASTFAAAVKDWTPEQKQVLINHTVNYMSDNPKAIFFHEFDWMPVQSLEKAFLKLSFKVRDITDGIGAAKWHNGCQFVSVSGYCKGEAEVWTFLKSDKSQIKAYGRDDFEVIGF